MLICFTLLESKAQFVDAVTALLQTSGEGSLVPILSHEKDALHTENH